MAKKKELYPHADDVRAGKYSPRVVRGVDDDAPDFIGGAPNYDKFVGWDVDAVLVWLNID